MSVVFCVFPHLKFASRDAERCISSLTLQLRMRVETGLNLETLMSIPEIQDAKVAPDKSMIAVVVNRLHQNYDVFVLPAGRPSELVSMTNTPEVTFITDWFPDSKSIVVGEDTARNERVTLYRVYLDEPEVLVPLTEKAPDHYLWGGCVGPSADYIVYAVNYDYETRREIETFRVIVQDIESGKRTVIARPEWPGYIQMSVDSKGRYVLYSRRERDPAGTQWWIASPDGAEDRQILNFGPKAKVSADWTHDGRVLFDTDTVDGKRHDSVGIGLYDLAKDDIDWLMRPSKKRPFDSSCVPKYSHHALFIRQRDARAKPFVYDLESSALTDCTPREGELLPITDLSAREWLGLYSSSTHATEVVRFNPSEPSPDRFVYLTRLLEYSGLRPEQLTPARDYRWTSVDGTRIHGWLYRPAHPNGKTVVHIHGGPTAHVSDRLSVQVQYLCSRGFTVLDPNYRGSTGYGADFRELLKEDGWGGKDKDDVARGIESMIADGHARAHSVGIYGTSYGGYMSWNAIVHFPTRLVAAAAPICGMTDLVVDYETTRPDIRPYSEEMMGGSPSQVPEKYRERSPINYVQSIKGHLLIVQGLRDPNVTPANVDAVEKRLKEHNIRYEKLTFDDEGHGIIREANAKVLLERLASFFLSGL